MSKLLSFLVLFSLCSFGQEKEIRIVVVDVETNSPVPGAEIAISGTGCVLEQSTDESGQASLIASKNEKCFQDDTFYQLEVYGRDGIYHGSTKKHYTGKLSQKKLSTDTLKVKFILKKGAPTIIFERGSSKMLEEHSKQSFNDLREFALENPELTIDIIGYYYEDQSTKIAYDRAVKVQEYLFKSDIPKSQIASIIAVPVPTKETYDLVEDRISLGPQHFNRNDSSEVGAGFMVSGMNEFSTYPCYGAGGKRGIAFDKNGREVEQQKCTTKAMLKEWIAANPGSKWKVVGLNYNREIESAGKLANDRAQIVKDILMELGVEEEAIQPSTEVVSAEARNKKHWPFLKGQSTYEIGVYVQNEK